VGKVRARAHRLMVRPDVTPEVTTCSFTFFELDEPAIPFVAVAAVVIPLKTRYKQS